MNIKGKIYGGGMYYGLSNKKRSFGRTVFEARWRNQLIKGTEKNNWSFALNINQLDEEYRNLFHNMLAA